MADEAIDVHVPAVTDKLVLELWGHQNGKDVFVFGKFTLDAPTVIKSLLENTIERFWQGVSARAKTTFVLLWSCVTDHGAIQAFLKNNSASLNVVVLCFEGPAVLQSCLQVRNQLITEVIFQAPVFDTSADAAKWLASAVFDTTSNYTRNECKPVVVDKDLVHKVGPIDNSNAMQDQVGVYLCCIGVCIYRTLRTVHTTCLLVYCIIYLQAQEIGELPIWLENILRVSCLHVRGAASHLSSMERARIRASKTALHKIGEAMIAKKKSITQTAFNEVERRLLEAGCWSEWPMNHHIEAKLLILRSNIR